MHKLVVLSPEPAGPDYYVTNHFPLVACMPGLLAWRHSFAVASTQGQTPYFAVFEAEFADAEAMTAARASPQGQRVAAVASYVTGGAVVIHYPGRTAPAEPGPRVMIAQPVCHRSTDQGA